jgi:hypothetical protein
MGWLAGGAAATTGSAAASVVGLVDSQPESIKNTGNAIDSNVSCFFMGYIQD